VVRMRLRYIPCVKITELIWPQDRVEHIAKHGIQPYEVDEICFGQSLVLRGKTVGKNPLYYVLGQTSAAVISFAW